MAQWRHRDCGCGWEVSENCICPSEVRPNKALLTSNGEYSDTTAPSLTNLLYLLARNPENIQKIQEEIDGIDTQDVRAVASLSHFNGAINESMRLLPAVLTALTRVTPPEGMEVDGTFIPGNLKIAAPRYTIGRCGSMHDPIYRLYHTIPLIMS